MPDWLSSMEQSFEYFIVNPNTWKDDRPIKTIKASTITRDSDSGTRGSASFDTTEVLDECYIRTYLVTIQNGVTERSLLGTHLVQTPSMSFNGKVHSVTADAYTSLLELSENPPPLGYSILKGENIMENAYRLVQEQVRAPVVKTECPDNLNYNFVAEPNDTWLLYCSDLIGIAKYEFDVDEMGRILFSPKQDISSLQPMWTYTDDNSSILYPDINFDYDLYDIPNVVEVTYSQGGSSYYARVVNDDPNSPTSIQSRGREITRRITDPNTLGNPTQEQITEYANQMLRDLSTLTRTVSYTHGYCPVRVGDCVRLNYERANLTNVKAKVISQSIKCTPGCPVSEKAVYTVKLWG